MRTPFLNIGEWARKGWLVQISGSKFLTGPPFSGALILPRSFRARAKRIGELLYQAPAVGFGGDWTSWWRDVFPSQTCEENTSFGLIFRWLPALLEAELFNAIPNELRQASFERFRKALTARLDKSQWLVRMDDSRGDERGVATETTSRANPSSVFPSSCRTGMARFALLARKSVGAYLIFSILILAVRWGNSVRRKLRGPIAGAHWSTGVAAIEIQRVGPRRAAHGSWRPLLQYRCSCRARIGRRCAGIGNRRRCPRP